MSNNLEQIRSYIPGLTDDELAETEKFLAEERGARVAQRNSALPEFPYVIGFGSKHSTQVTRAKAIELLNAGTHRLADYPTAE